MIKLIKEFLETGIKANNLKIDEANTSIKGWNLHSEQIKLLIEWHNFTCRSNDIRIDNRIEYLSKKVSLSEEEAYELSLLPKLYYVTGQNK